MTTEKKKVHFPNPIPSMFVFFLVALLAGAAVIAYIWVHPGAIGVARTETIGDTVYSFSNLEFSRPHLDAEFDTGWIVPFYRNGDIAGALVMGSGSYLVEADSSIRDRLEEKTGHQEIYDRLTAMYVPCSFRSFENMVYKAGAEKQSNQRILDQSQKYLEAIKNTRTTVRTYGIRRDWFTNSNVVQLFGDSFGRVSYAAGTSVTLTFLDIDGLELTMGGQQEEHLLHVLSTRLSAAPQFLLIYISLTLLCLFLVYALTIDAVPNERQLAMQSWSSSETVHLLQIAAVALLGIIAALVVNTALIKVGTIEKAAVGWRVASAVLVLFLAWRSPFPMSFTGLTRDNLLRAVLLGIVLGLLGFSCGTLSIPEGFRQLPRRELLFAALRAFLIAGYAAELFRRSFLQTLLQYAVGSRWGLVVTALFLGVIYLAPRWFMAGTPGPAVLVQGTIIVPIYSFLLGYIFERTGSIHASAITAGLMALLPELVLF